MECFLLIVVTFLSGETEAVIQSCSQEKLFWKYAANLKENAHVKVQSNFIEIALRHGCSPVNLLHLFRAPFSKNTFGGLLLNQGRFRLSFITLDHYERFFHIK